MAKTIAVTEQPSTGLQQLKTQPARLVEFLKDVRSEMRKVITPSRAVKNSCTSATLSIPNDKLFSSTAPRSSAAELNFFIPAPLPPIFGLMISG